MIKIDKVKWGNVWVNGQKYHQALVIGEKILERESEKLRQLFRTTHQLGDWEEKQLFSGQPEVILIANGWEGVLKVGEEFKNKAKKKGLGLKIVLTGKIIKEYERLLKEGKKVNALIHTTC